MSEKARKDKSAKIAANSSHVGYNGTDSDLSGRLSTVSLGHSRHAGASRPADEKMVNVGSAEGSSAGLNRAPASEHGCAGSIEVRCGETGFCEPLAPAFRHGV